MANGIAQNVFHGLRQCVEVAHYLAIFRDLCADALARPAGFEAGVFADYVPERRDVHRLAFEAGLFTVQPGELEGAVDQLLHAGDLAVGPAAQLLGTKLALTGHAQAAEWGAQLMGKVTQQLLLLADRIAQALGEVRQRAAQLA